jgi:hypothetical protein
VTLNINIIHQILSSYRILARIPEGRRLLGRPRHRGENNVKINVIEIECEDVDQTQLVITASGNKCGCLGMDATDCFHVFTGVKRGLHTLKGV